MHAFFHLARSAPPRTSPGVPERAPGDATGHWRAARCRPPLGPAGGASLLCRRRIARPWSLLLAAWLLGATQSVLGLTSYTDPVGYPAAWPTELTAGAYTAHGVPMIDLTGRADASAGANPSGSVDFSSGPANDQPSFCYYGNGTILFFRLRIDGYPLALTGSGQPFGSITHNVLFDTDGDGFKEFLVMLDGTSAGPQPDDIVVVYENVASQSWSTTQVGVWRQDCAGASDGQDGSAGTSASWDTNADAWIWDFGRVRVTQIDRAKDPGKGQEFWLDLQVPLVAFDATAIGGPTLASIGLFTLAATSSNSNTDPTQKDLLYNGSIALANVALPGGDLTNRTGTILLSPAITAVTTTACPSPITVHATVVDATSVDPATKLAKDTIASVRFQAYYDANANGTADDTGQTWNDIGTGVASATLGLWSCSWPVGSLVNGRYLVRAIAVDDDGNSTTSTEQSSAGLGSISATFNHTCCAAAVLTLSDKTVNDINGGVTAPGDTLAYTITLRNRGGLAATNVAVRDTLPAYLSYVSGTASPVPTATAPALYWNVGTLDTAATKPYSFRAVVAVATPDTTRLTNRATITYTSGSTSGLVVQVTASLSVARPVISCAKSVDRASASPGDTLVYTLTYANQGSAGATYVIISDTVPSHTSYVPGSVTLNGVARTDVADADAVTVSGSSISIHVGTVAAGATGQVLFRARVQ